MPPNLTPEQEGVVEARLRDALEYYRRTNEILGVLGFTSGIASISTENPRFYAFLTAAFLALVWIYQTSSFKRRIALLKHINHRDMRFYNVWFRAWPAIVGWMFLGVISAGFLDKYGVQGKPDLPICLRTAQTESSSSVPRCVAVR